MAHQTVTRTGMIGLGAMGLQMARHMVNKGFEVWGFDVDGEAMKRAQSHGVKAAASVAEVGRHAQVVLVMVATDKQIGDVIERSGLLDSLAPGAVIAIASSCSPDTCRRLAELAAPKQIGVVDTPLVLGQEACDNGQVVAYVGGDDQSVALARSAIAAFSAQVLHVGTVGAGQITKSINNMLLWSCMVANYESLTFAKQLGVDIPRLIEALGHGSGANWSLSRWGKSTGKWAEKDMDVALDLAQQAKMPMPLAGLVDQLVKHLNQERMKALMS
jgi:3-hydroxyisobutyrate dehydrogenase-like beta-hydroxyacid dehydrogenase